MRIKEKRTSMSWKARRVLLALTVGGSFMVHGVTAFASANGDGRPASNNEVTVSNRTIDGSAYGGYSGVYRDHDPIEGGHAESGDASKNVLKISDTIFSGVNGNQIDAGYIQGGNGSANNNTTTLMNVKAENYYVHGGFATGSGDASNNIVNIIDSTIRHLHGGHAVSGNANGNVVNFFSGTVTQLIGAGLAESGTANNNVLNIYGGTMDGGTATGYHDASDDRGIYAGLTQGTGSADGNTLNIYGGTIRGDVYAGWAPSGTARNNTVNIYGSPDLTFARIHAGNAPVGAVMGNDLNIHTKNLTAENIYDFENLNYYLPSNIVSGDSLLTLTGTTGTDLSNTAVNVYSTNGATLNTGDTFTLLRNDNGITYSNVTNSGLLAEGVSMDYGLTLSPSGKGKSATSIVATVGERATNSLKAQTGAIAQSALPGIELVNAGSDRILHWLPPEEEQAAEEETKDVEAETMEPANEFRMFANMDFSSLRTKTGNGSFVDSKSGGMDLGWARSIDNAGGKLIFAPVIDYGTGNYDSYFMSNGNRIHGHGKTTYAAAGMIARQIYKNGFYVEGSFRMGRATSDFSSGDFTMGGTPVNVSYDTSAPIWAAHVHLGRFYKFGPQDTLQIYGHYFHAHQGSMSADLSTGEHYSFGAVNNGRFRMGIHLTRQINKKSCFYSGIAYQYESSGDASASYRGMSTPSSRSKGSSGMIELGWQMKPSQRVPWMVDAGLVGWVGHQRGITFQVKFKKSF